MERGAWQLLERLPGLFREGERLLASVRYMSTRKQI